LRFGTNNEEWFMATLLQDLHYGIRMLANKTGFTLLAVLTLALGIGANTAIFSVVNSVLLRSLPYAQADRIVILGSYWTKTGSIGWVSQPDFQDWHDQSNVFDAMAYYATGEPSVAGGSTADFSSFAVITPEFFRVFSVQPQVGRAFSLEEQRIGGPRVALISDSFWDRNYGRNPSALGQALRTENMNFSIVGVMPKGFHFPDANEVWLPMAVFQEPGEKENRDAHNYQVVGRLKSGVSLQTAQAQMKTIGAHLEEQYPNSNENKSVAVVPMQELAVRNVRTTLYLLLGAVALVLLIACANVANLLLARAAGRAREIAVRSAMGASRGRIVRQLMVESVTLSVMAGALGVLFAAWGTSALIALAPDNVPRLSEAHVDATVLGFALLISLVSCVFFGLAPALQASRVNLSDALKQGGARSGSSGSSGLLRSSLVVAEIAFSVILVAAAGLLLKSLIAISHVDLGFQPDHVLVMRNSVPSADLESHRRAADFYTQLLQRASGLPGVQSVAAANGTPAGGIMSNGAYWLEGGPGPDEIGVSAPQAGFPVVTPGYFRTLRIPIVKGRDFSDRDTYQAPLVAIISESLAQQAFPGTDPVGKRILCGLDNMNWMTIIGVAGEIRMDNPTVPPGPQLYMPYLQHLYHASAMRVLIRTQLEPQTLDATLQKMVRELNPNVPTRFTTLDAMLSDSISTSRFSAALIALFAALALLLAMAGVYGVMAFTLSQRSGEIGVRVAMGAQPGHILQLVLGKGLRLAFAGIVLGIAGAFSMARLLAAFLFATPAYDLATFATVCFILIVAALAACYIPARRAMRVDPIVALRYE
jgi:putative ABC transport system permease protein